MAIFLADDKQFQFFIDDTNTIIERLSSKATKSDLAMLEKLIENFKIKTKDFYRENRKLNIGIVGQVKAGKSSFLNTLLFNGEEILPKASTPKTATLTKMEYSEHNIIQVEYYSVEEWEVLEDNALVDLDDEVYTSAREIVGMVRRNGLEPIHYLEMGNEQIEFATYNDLIANLNNYVGEDGKFTPIVKSVTLYLNKEEFKELSIVDTPGLNDPIASRTIRTKEFMEVCDVVFFLSQSGSFLDKSDWILLSSQLPQKGVKKLVLVASKYDSGIRDILRVQDDDDIFGEDNNTADTIPKACKIIKKKLKKRAKVKVEEFIKDLSVRESSSELIEVIKQCSDPILVSSIACNMAKKKEEDYTKEERNVYAALKKFSDDMENDLHLLGNFDEINSIFASVVVEKEALLEQKAKSFIPTAMAELLACLEDFKAKASKRLSVLEQNDKEALLEQKKFIEGQINNIRADITAVFGELNTKLETEKAEGVREIRQASKDYLDVRERTGSITRHGSYTTGHLWWKKTHYYTYQEHYSYCIASDAIDNLRKFSMEAVNQVEKVFSDALELKEIKRRLLNVVVQNFDMGSEKYDSALFRILIEETVAQIEFPVFNIDISDAINGITAKFTGELTSAGQKTELTTALSKAISRIYDELCKKLTSSVAEFKAEMKNISKTVENSLLENINNEFEILLAQYEHKEKEIAEYKSYIELLDKEIARL
ncbi:dynamin family protein [Phascolarctobacterium faecium]|nr:dynamin family protein [Phascolarctobacterium faecium]MDM8109078.1 dynamin family protein [Phascolarctobacterium faecium]